MPPVLMIAVIFKTMYNINWCQESSTKTHMKGSNTMNLRKVLKALFFHKEEPVELDLSAAEIQEGKAYLHSKNEKGVTYLVRSDNIEISLSKGFSLSPEQIVKIEPKGKHKTPEPNATDRNLHKNNPIPRIAHDGASTLPVSDNAYDKYKKRKFVVSLYPDEYASVMASMKEYGYKRADFVLACVNTATKGTMEREHKKIIKVHNALRKEEKSLYSRQNDTLS